MKKAYSILATIILVLTIVLIQGIPTKAKDKFSQKPGITSSIPDSIYRILKFSCMSCHSGEGNIMAVSHLDFDKWEKYKLKKKIKKGNNICEMITEGKMPPKKELLKKPETVLTKAQIKSVCDWVVSLKAQQQSKK